MTTPADHWEEVRRHFDAARALPDADRRGYLRRECADPDVRAEVEALLEGHAALQQAPRDGFLERLGDERLLHLFAGAADEPAPGGLAAGDRLGRYRMVRPIGHGGMGVVYLAHDERLDRPAALKLLPRHLNVDAAARRRFEAEARVASSLDHPNVATIYEIGDTADGRVFIAMAFCDGETLCDELERGPLPVHRALRIASQVAEGLAAAHDRGIVHRDIKPANIIVSAEGVARIVDFGIATIAGAALVQTASTPGTVAYMSPERTRESASNPRADVWSFGATLYEMLAGRRPFRADGEQALIYAIRNDEPTPLEQIRAGIPPALCRLVEKCLNKDPEERYPQASALLAGLRAVAADSAAQAPVADPGRRRAPVILTAGAVAVAIIAAALIGLRGGPDWIDPALADGSAAAPSSGNSTDRSSSTESAQAFPAPAAVTPVSDRGADPPSAGAASAPIDSLLDLLDVDARAAERRRVEGRAVPDPDAYTAYLKGRYFLSKLDQHSFELARDHFRRALDVDPTFAPAWSGLADAWGQLAGMSAVWWDDAFHSARAAAEKALELDPDLAEAHASLAMALTSYFWESELAEHHFRRAIELDPDYADTHYLFARHLRNRGRFDEAMVHARMATRLDPLAARPRVEEGLILYLAGRYDDAIAHFDRFRTLFPDYTYANFHIALIAAQQHRFDAALAALDSIGPEAANADAQAVRGVVYAMAGRHQDARRMLARLERLQADQPVSEFQKAAIHVQLGEHDRALDLLEDGARRRMHGFPVLPVEPIFRPLHGNPRFTALLRSTGLDPGR